jgi:hypothetical protein
MITPTIQQPSISKTTRRSAAEAMEKISLILERNKNMMTK